MDQPPRNLGTPAIEISADGDDIVLRAELTGIAPQDVGVRITDDGVTLAGERPDERRGTFSQTIPFPEPVHAATARTTYQDGFLEVRATRRSRAERRTGGPVDGDIP